MSLGWEERQERLAEVLAERTATPEGARRTELDAELASLAAALGLDVAEIEALTPAQIDPPGRAPGIQGRFRIMRRARDVMPFYVGFLLVPMVAGLGAPAPAAAGAAVVLAAAVVHHRRRLSVFEIDALDRLDIRHVGFIDWGDVDEVSYRLRYPWLEPRRPTLARGVTAKVRIGRVRGRDLRLAQGQLFQIRPARRPVTFDHLGSYLRRQAKAAGLHVERLPAKREGWRATRRARLHPGLRP